MRCALPGLQSVVVEERERDCEHARIQSEPDHRVEAAKHDEAGHSHGPHDAGALSRGLAGRPDHRYGRR